MSLLLLAGRGRGAADVGGGGALALTLGGASQALSYSEPLGVYQSGAARTLFVQFTRSMTNGSPVSGTLTVPGRSIAVNAHRFASGTGSTLVSFAVTLQDGDIPAASIASCTTGSWTDDSATWANSNSSTWYTGGTGIPAGVLWPTSKAHLNAANSFSKTMDQSAQPVFTGSAAVDTTFETINTATLLAWNGAQYPGAQYERSLMLWDYACRTGDVTYLREALAHASRMRTVFWSSNLIGLGEQWQSLRTWSWLYLMRRDTVLLGSAGSANGLFFIGSASYNASTWFHTENPRFAASRIKAVAACIKAGLGNTQNQYGSGTFLDMADLLVTEGLAKGSAKLTQSNNRVTIPFYANDGTTVTRSVYPYMVALYVDAFLELLEVMPSSANKTAMYAQLSASVLWVRQNMQTTSSGGSRTYLYQDVDVWYAAVPGTLTANYTAGSTSMSIAIAVGAAPPDGWAVSGTFSAGCVVRIGGVSKSITALFTTDGSGHATVTLESGGFGSSYSSGQAITFMRDAAVGVSVNNVDLNGMLAPMFAWRAWFENSSADADEARTLYPTIGYTPQDGSTGPYISDPDPQKAQKQCDETFRLSQTTPAWLDMAGI